MHIMVADLQHAENIQRVAPLIPGVNHIKFIYISMALRSLVRRFIAASAVSSVKSFGMQIMEFPSGQHKHRHYRIQLRA